MPEGIERLEEYNSLRLEVVYAGSNTIAELLRAGAFDSVDPEVNDLTFPVWKTEKVRVIPALFKLERNYRGPELHHALGQNGCRPMNTVELLTLGIAHPRLQMDLPLIISWDAGLPLPRGREQWPVRYTLCLGGNHEHRGVGIVEYDGIFSAGKIMGAVVNGFLGSF